MQVDAIESYLKNNILLFIGCLSHGCLSLCHETFSFMWSPSSQGCSQNWVLDRRWRDSRLDALSAVRFCLHFCWLLLNLDVGDVSSFMNSSYFNFNV